jgi:hypothetical protein
VPCRYKEQATVRSARRQNWDWRTLRRCRSYPMSPLLSLTRAPHQRLRHAHDQLCFFFLNAMIHRMDLCQTKTGPVNYEPRSSSLRAHAPKYPHVKARGPADLFWVIIGCVLPQLRCHSQLKVRERRSPRLPHTCRCPLATKYNNDIRSKKYKSKIVDASLQN